MDIFSHYTIIIRRLRPYECRLSQWETLDHNDNSYVATIPELKTKNLWAIGKDPIAALENLTTAFELWRSRQAALHPDTAAAPGPVEGQQRPDTGASNCKSSPTPDVSRVIDRAIEKLNQALDILQEQD